MAKKRKSGTGTVRQRGDGRWEGRVVIGYDDNGLPKTKNVLAKTKRECQEKLRQLTESMVGRNDRKVKSDMLFGDWLCYWYETHSKPTLRASTQNNYENVIHNHVLPEIGKIPLNKLSQNDLQQFYGRLKKEWPQASDGAIRRGTFRPHGADVPRGLPLRLGTGRAG